MGAQSAGIAASAAWRDPVFGNPLPFYFFDLPFYSLLLRPTFLAVAFVTTIVYWLAARGWMISGKQEWQFDGSGWKHQHLNFRLRGGLEPLLLRVLVALF